jgi:hypothetical protein
VSVWGVDGIDRGVAVVDVLRLFEKSGQCGGPCKGGLGWVSVVQSDGGVLVVLSVYVGW